MKKFAYILVVIAATGWGMSGIAGQKLFDAGLDPFTVIWYRTAVAMIVLTAGIFSIKREWLKIKFKDIPALASFGIISVGLFYITYFNAINEIGVAMAVILMYTSPAFVVIISRLKFGEMLNTWKIIGLIVTLCGCFLVLEGYNLEIVRLNLPGVLFGLGAGFTFGMYSVFGKVVSSYPAGTVIFYNQLFGFFLLTFFFNPLSISPLSFDFSIWGLLIFLGIVSTILAYSCYNIALKYLHAGQASIVTTVEPVIAVLLAYLILGEILGTLQILGAVLIILAVIMVKFWGHSKEAIDRDVKQSWLAK